MRFSLVLAALLLSSCTVPVREGPGTRFLRSKCGACHLRTEPGPAALAAWLDLEEYHRDLLHLDERDVRLVREELGRSLAEPGRDSMSEQAD